MIESNFIDMSAEDVLMSNSLFGFTLKCIIAPYHSYEQLKDIVPYTETTFLFPERDVHMSYDKAKGFISMLANRFKNTNAEIRIVTASMSIIGDLPKECTSILKEDGTLVKNPEKTFLANIHSIRLDILESENYRLSSASKNMMQQLVNDLIDKINSSLPFNKMDYDDVERKIKTIGEPLIGNKLLEMLHQKGHS